MSRTVNGEALFQKKEKEVLRRMLWQVADFSGVKILTYAVMKNHFHLLVEVPKDQEISDEELIRRYKILYPRPTPWQPMLVEVLESYLKSGSEEGRAIRQSLTKRMHDISWLMKTIKQRFSIWFNQSMNRFGPLWSERFKSVLVEGDHWALKTVAAYIDLNAVRAGIVRDPKDYRFCGYGEAIGGSKAAQRGLSVFSQDLVSYRKVLYGSGAQQKDGKSSIPSADARKVIEGEGGELPIHTILRCKVRYFTEGKILGSSTFVEKLLHEHQQNWQKPKEPKPMIGSDWQGLHIPSGIRKNWF